MLEDPVIRICSKYLDDAEDDIGCTALQLRAWGGNFSDSEGNPDGLVWVVLYSFHNYFYRLIHES